MSILRQQLFRGHATRFLNSSNRANLSAAFNTSAARLGGKDATERDPQAVENEKQDQLKKQDKGKGHWKDALASESESAVKADRNETERDAKEDTEKLQRETEDAPRKKHGQ